MDFFVRKKTEGLDFRPLTAIAVGRKTAFCFLGFTFWTSSMDCLSAIIGANYRLLFVGASFRGALLHTSQGTMSLDPCPLSIWLQVPIPRDRKVKHPLGAERWRNTHWVCPLCIFPKNFPFPKKIYKIRFTFSSIWFTIEYAIYNVGDFLPADMANVKPEHTKEGGL